MSEYDDTGGYDDAGTDETPVDDAHGGLGEAGHTIVEQGADGSTTYIIDSDNDGYADVVAVDADSDGIIDRAFVDTDHDHKLDTVLVDSDDNGTVDAEYADTDGDGRIDLI